MNLNPDDGIPLYTGRFFETRLQAGDPSEPPLIILSLITIETNQALVLTLEEMAELSQAAAAAMAALAGSSLNTALPLLADERLGPGQLPAPGEGQDVTVVFPTRRSL